MYILEKYFYSIKAHTQIRMANNLIKIFLANNTDSFCYATLICDYKL